MICLQWLAADLLQSELDAMYTYYYTTLHVQCQTC